MGLIQATIELANAVDLINARRHLIGEEEIRRTQATMLVDTGSTHMCINEYIQEVLQLSVHGIKRVQMADGQIIECDMVGPIEARFKDRWCHVDAIVLPGDTEPLLGAVPMEDMDVMVHPRRQELDVNPNHPEGGLWRL